MTTQGNSASRCNALPVTHVDLATLTALEAYLYGGHQCSTWLHREVNKANWAAVGYTTLRNTGGKPDYGRDSSWLVSRGGDYLLHAFYRARFPLIKLKNDLTLQTDASIRYCKNFMHNLVRSGSLTVNELCISIFDTFILDVRQAFWLPSNKQLGYKNMIGDIPSMTSPAGWDSILEDFSAAGTGGFLTLVLPFFFHEDYGVSLPTASLIYVELFINLEFRDFEDLVIVHPGSNGNAVGGGEVVRSASHADIEVCGKAGCKPTMENGDLYAEYAVVNNDERKAMAKMKRTMVVKNWQRMQEQSWDSQSSNHFNLRFSYNVQAIFTAVRNDATAGDCSNYTTGPYSSGVDPIGVENLQYENSSRTGDVPADLSSLVFAFLRPGMAVPEVTGLHLLVSFALDPLGQDPSYGPNLGKINQIILNSYPSEAGRKAGHPTDPCDIFDDPYLDASEEPKPHTQRFTKMVAALHQSLLNVTGGTITVPVV